MCASKAGAKEIIACEENKSMASLASKIISANKLSRGISVVEKNSTELSSDDLPWKADLVITETLDSGELRRCD